MKDWHFLLIIILVGLVTRAPFYRTVFWRTGDSVDYISVARNINSGAGFVTSVKSAFYNMDPVISPAWGSRPIGMVLIAAVILRTFANNLYSLQIFSLLIGIFGAIIFYFLARTFFPPLISFLGALLAIFNPNILISNRLFLSEPVFICFIMLGMLILLRAQKKFLAGIFFGLAYLIRLEGIFLPLIFVFLGYSPVILMGFVVAAFPSWLGNFISFGNPFYSYNYVHFRVKEFQEYFAYGFGRTFPSAQNFIRQNFTWIIAAISKTTFLHLASLTRLDSLGLLTVPLLISLKKFENRFQPLFLFCLASIITYGLLWSAIFERARHFIPIYYLLLIPILAIINSHRKNFFVWAMIVFTLFSYLTFDVHRLVWARNVDTTIDNWSPKQKGELFAWLSQNTIKPDIISATDPMLVNLFVDRPTILLPQNIYSPDQYQKFVHQYQVKYILADDPKNFDFFAANASFKIEKNGVRVYAN